MQSFAVCKSSFESPRRVLLFLPYFVKLCGFYLVLTDTDSLERLESWKGYFHIPASK